MRERESEKFGFGNTPKFALTSGVGKIWWGAWKRGRWNLKKYLGNLLSSGERKIRDSKREREEKRSGIRDLEKFKRRGVLGSEGVQILRNFWGLYSIETYFDRPNRDYWPKFHMKFFCIS